MTELTIAEQSGVRDFLLDFLDEGLAYTLAKVICKNLLNPNTYDGKYLQTPIRLLLKFKFVSIRISEAIDMVILHSPSMPSIMHRKAITKAHLFKYMHKRQIAANSDHTKQLLLDKLLSFWADILRPRTPSPEPQSYKDLRPDTPPTLLPTSSNQVTITPIPENVENFPIHLLSRRFAGWFFEQYNASSLTLDDFWPDVKCDAELMDGAVIQQQIDATGHHPVYDLLVGLKSKYGFYFNPSVSHSGVQGRIDQHGMVLVLSCGTLHTQQQFAGLFECGFGLVRDPFTDNNWKIKFVRMRLKSVALAAETDFQTAPDLRQCDSLQPWLTLPQSVNDINME